MRIGVDLDNTVFCTSEQYKKYQQDYTNMHNITENELWSNKKFRLDFIKTNLNLIFSDVELKDSCIEVLKKLRSENNKIYIITARSNEYCDNMYEFTKENIENNGIPYDKLILTEKYKLKACLDNDIDVMIDDSEYIINELKGKVKYLLFDDKNKYPACEEKVTSWKEIYQKLGGDV